jgi:hypothetical protein
MRAAAMTYTIAIEPSETAGKVNAHSSDGHTFTTATPLLTGARYWQNVGEPSTASIVTVWSTGRSAAPSATPLASP